MGNIRKREGPPVGITSSTSVCMEPSGAMLRRRVVRVFPALMNGAIKRGL